MEFKNLSLVELAKAIKEQKISSEEVTRFYIKNCEDKANLNAVLEIFYDAIDEAKLIDEKIKNGENVGKFAGVPILIKDNISLKGKHLTCGSKFLVGYTSPYDSTVVKKLKKEGFIFIGRTNMDEFAMGSSTENSAFGICHNALDFDRVPGGSSGGSAVAVAGELSPVSLGTDTGGSVRQPSSYNGVVGMKPTYGRVSRYGIVAYGSSLDQVGPITKTVEDNAELLQVMAGADEHDQTSLKDDNLDFTSKLNEDIKGMKIGLSNEIMDKLKQTEVYPVYEKLFNWLNEQGCEIVNVSTPNITNTLPAYYVIAFAEVSSNLGRFDGIRYTVRNQEAKDVDEIYRKSRTDGFGKEVKRRIMLGNYVLSSGYYDAYYLKAKKVQQKVTDEIKNVFKSVDIMLTPTTCGEAFKIGEKVNDPVSMYLEDIFTIIANTTGVPCLSIPCGKGEHNMPLGLQIFAKHKDEATIYQLANFIEKNYKGAK